MALANPGRSARLHSNRPTGLSGVAGLGYAITFLLFGSFMYWAATAQLGGATVANGIVIAAGQNILVQHPDGGLVAEVLVKEGDNVVAGDMLFRLDDVEVRAQVNRLAKLLETRQAQADRLVAERDGKSAIEFSALVTDENLKMDQVSEFDTRLARFSQELSILAKRQVSMEETIRGLEAQQAALDEQLRVVRDERVRKEKLLDQGLANRSDYSAILLSEAELTGSAGSIVSEIASANARMLEAGEQIERLRTQRVETALASLAELRGAIIELGEQLEAARAVMQRTVIRAPVDGVVVKQQVNAVGAVLRPGEAFLELLPTGNAYVVEARVSPLDRNEISIGQDVRLVLVALGAGNAPEMPGRVEYISADRLNDQQTGLSFFVVRVSFGDELPENVTSSDIYSGMPVDAFIATGSRTFLEYILRPLRDSMQRAFRKG